MDILCYLLVPMFSLGDAETQNIILKFSKCIKVVKYVKIMLECAL